MIWIIVAIVVMFLLSAIICLPDKFRKKGKK